MQLKENSNEDKNKGGPRESCWFSAVGAESQPEAVKINEKLYDNPCCLCTLSITMKLTYHAACIFDSFFLSVPQHDENLHISYVINAAACSLHTGDVYKQLRDKAHSLFPMFPELIAY